MLHQRKILLTSKLRFIMVVISLVVGFYLPYIQAKASNNIINKSSDTRENCRIEVDGYNFILEGQTNDDVDTFNICMIYEVNDQVVSVQVFNGSVSNGIYNETMSLPSINGIPEDGTYIIQIELSDAKWNAKINVENGVVKARLTNKRIFLNFIETKYFMTVGETFTFKVETPNPDDEVKWSIPDNNIAVIDSEGKVTALAIGDTRVIARIPKAEVSYPITVSEELPVTGSTTYAAFFFAGAMLMMSGAFAFNMTYRSKN